MKVFRRLSPNIISPSALAIGNFDGVHRGHQALLSKLKEVASRLGVLPTVLTVVWSYRDSAVYYYALQG